MFRNLSSILALSWALQLGSVASPAEPAETPVKLSDLPPAAQKAVQARLGDGQLGELLRSTDRGENHYAVEVSKAGATSSFTIDEAGTLLEEEVALAQTPPAVQKAIRAHLGRTKADGITKVIDDGEATYEVAFTRAGKERDFVLSATGRLLKAQVFLPELSSELQAAITNAAGGGVLGDLYRTIDEGEVSYEVEVTSHGKTRTLTFEPKGTLVAEEEPVALADAPAAVQKTLEARLAGGGKLLSLDKTTEAGASTYDVELLKSGKRESLSLGPDGKVMP